MTTMFERQPDWLIRMIAVLDAARLRTIPRPAHGLQVVRHGLVARGMNARPVPAGWRSAA